MRQQRSPNDGFIGETTTPMVGDVLAPFHYPRRDWDPNSFISINYECVVIAAHRAEDGYGHGPGDVYPGAWQFQVQELDQGGVYNPERLKTWCAMDEGCSYGVEKVTVLRQMHRSVDFT